MKHRTKILISVITALALSACGGSSSDRSANGSSGEGKLSLSITDAPVDGAKEVWITIEEVMLKRSGDEEKTITLTGPDVDPVDGTLTVDLLALSGGQLSQLFNNETVTAGSYQWVRFGLVDGTSKIVWDDDTESPLQLPANKNELKTSGSFSVNADESVAYIIDWDLRKSIVKRNASSGSEYMLKPVLHIKRDDVYAYATGTVNDDPLFNSCGPEEVPSIYVFSGMNVTPDDLGSEVEPILSVYVSDDPQQSFYLGPLDPGAYTLAFTCDSLDDDPESGDDDLVFPPEGTANITLESGDNGNVITL